MSFARVAMWTPMGVLLWHLYAVVSDLPDGNAVRAAGSMARATTIADAKGRHAFTIFQERRLPVPLSQVSQDLTQAILTIEDQRFYRHGGVDLIRVAGAAMNNLVKLRAEQGGSTITQQLARLTFLSPDKTIRRKLQELIIARRLECAFTKREILEAYLNRAYFGDGLYGIEAASLGYLGKHASELNVPEAALLAGLVKAPSTYAPTVSPERALTRRNVVLRAMRTAGVLDEDAYQSAVRSPVRIYDMLRREEAYGQYFKEEVRKQLVRWFGSERVYQDGLRVETTLDLDLQRAAEGEVARALAEIEQRQARRGRRRASHEDVLQAALVALDPHTGEVRAMVGGRDFEQSRFNRATQARRQPGSAFKPIVYAAALEKGFTPATVITGLTQPVMASRGPWLPDDEHGSDVITMRAALRTSSNRAAVRMLQVLGIPTVVSYAGRLGLGDLPHVPSLALGSGEVTPLALTSAFAVFANGGRLAPPMLIRRVTAYDGSVLYEARVAVKTVVSPSTAFLISSMLQDVLDAGTGWRARQMGFRLPAAGKTGTSNDYRDAWFVGYTPTLVTGVWVGYDLPRTIIPGGSAGELAVPLWTRFMTAATRGDVPASFEAPSGVTAAEICGATGRLATQWCPRDPGAVHMEYFARGTEPVDWCPLHRPDRRGFWARLFGVEDHEK